MATDHNSKDDLICPVPEKKLKIDQTAETSLYESTLIKQFQQNSQNYLGFSQSMENTTQETKNNAQSVENQEKEGENNMGFVQTVENKQGDTVMIEAVSGVGNEYQFLGVKNQDVDDVVDGDDEKLLSDKGVENTVKNRKKARRRAKRRGKGKDWNGRSVEKERVFKCGIGCEMKKEWTGLMYSRKEMEDLRFLNKEDQMKKWVEIYCGLGPVLSEEYDALVVHENKEDGLDFDPRKNFKEKVSASGNMGGGRSQALDSNKVNPPDTASELSGCDLDSSTVIEDDCSEDDDSDAEYNSIHRPAFLVTGEPNFDAGPAMDGFEYLRRVRWETERVQKVTFAKIEESKLCEQTVYIPKIPKIVKCPQHLLPPKEWESLLLNEFSELRLAISRYENSNNEVPGKLQSVPNILEEDCSTQIIGSGVFYNPTAGTGPITCYNQSSAGDEEDASTISSPKISTSEDMAKTPDLSTISCFMQSAADDEDDTSPKTVTTEDIVNSPTLSTVLGIEPVARVSMLKKRIKLAEDMTSLSKNDCVWLFALCAAIDTPLNADTSAALRDLLRKCASLRAEKSELDDEVVMLNILATIAGKYFGQSDN